MSDYGSAWSAESLFFNCRCGQQWRSGAIPVLTAVASSRGAVESHLLTAVACNKGVAVPLLC